MSQNQSWGAPPPGQPPAGQPPAGHPPTSGQPGNWAPPPQGPGSNWQSKYCHACGSIIDSRAELCPRCGVRQHDYVANAGKDRPIAIVLALLLGGLGVHRFYLGPIAWGIVYLVFFWTGIPAFLAWLEAIYFLSRSNEDWARTYGGPVKQPNGVAMGCLWIVALFPLLFIVLMVALVLLAIPVALTT